MVQFTPPPPVGTPYAPRPLTPRGLYGPFGAPDTIIRIHFPDEQTAISKPWYWFIPPQQPQAFSYLAGVWGPGWVRQATYPVIKILAADTQGIVPIPQVGFPSVERAAQVGNPASFGRINFGPPQFWFLATDDAITSGGQVQDRPPFGTRNGLMYDLRRRQTSSTTPFSTLIRDFVFRWRDRWNQLAGDYNAQAASITPLGGFQYAGQAQRYQVQLPSGPPTTISTFQRELQLFANQGNPQGRYMGPVPPTAFFNINTITTQAYAFTIEVGQLSDTEWDMSVFPPREVNSSLTIKSSKRTGNYNGFGPTPIPYSGPIL